MHIIQREPRPRELSQQDHQTRQLVPEDRIRHDDLLLDLRRDRRVVIRLVGPVMVRADAVILRRRIQRRQVQRDVVQQHEVARAARIHAPELREHAVRVVHQRGPGHLAVGEEGADAEVVGADPERVDGLIGRGVQEGGAVGFRYGGVGDPGRNLVLLGGGEVGVDEGEIARGYVVAADGSGNRIVVEVDTGILTHVLHPGSPTVGRVITLRFV